MVHSKVSHVSSTRSHGSKRGFTLIELLIVVAIIALLAVIAVPNYLEAQVRAKVARAYANQRTAALTLEMYAVDHNDYPPWFMIWYSYPPGGGPRGEHWAGLPIFLLTSPIAYVSDGIVFYDEFSQFEVYSWYRLKSHGLACWRSDCAYVPPPTKPCCARDGDEGSSDYFDGRKLEFLSVPGRMCPKTAHYVVMGAGPTLRILDPFGYTSPMYDASNGTVSEGKIYRYGP